MKKTLLTFASALLCLGATAQEPVVKTFDAVADTWIRSNNTGWNSGGSGKNVETNTPEIKEGDQVVGYAQFVALYGFDYRLPEGMKVQQATMRLVTERYKGLDMYVHGYPNNFDEKASWNTEGSYVEALYDEEPLAVFKPAGQWNKAIWDNGLTEDKQNLESWINDIDVTAHVKTLTANDTRANFLLYQELGKKGNQNCFYTKDNEGEEGTSKYGYTFTKEQLVPRLIVTFVEDAATSNVALDPIADTWVRSDKAGDKKGADGSMEICYQMNADNTARDKQFYGIMSFKLPADVVDGTCEVTGAKLRLSHEMIKGDRNMEIYSYPAVLDEAGACWNTEADNIATALSAEPIATYSANGQGNKAMWDALSDNFKTAEAWTNTIDLTEYLKANPHDLNILISKKNPTPGNSIKVVSKDTKGQENTKDEANPFSFKAEDIKPLLFITYSKKEVDDPNTSVDEVGIDENSPVEYYNLQGVRVENPANGLYIKRQGTKVEKVLVR